MAVSDPFEGLGDGGPRMREPIRGWLSEVGRTAFWTVASLGVLVLCAAWFMYGLAGLDEMTDSYSAVARESSTLLLLGVIPVIVVHALLLIVLVSIGVRYHRPRSGGVLLALCSVAIASGVGIAVNELLTAGCLFAMSAQQTCPAFVP